MLDPRRVNEGNSWEDEEQPAQAHDDGSLASSILLQPPGRPREMNSGELPILVEATMVHEDNSLDERRPIQLVEAKPFTVCAVLLQRNVQIGLFRLP
jgi:hypothetical protein